MLKSGNTAKAVRAFASTNARQNVISKTTPLPTLMHPALIPRKNPFLKPIPAFLRNFKTFEPISIINASAKIFNAPIRVDIMHRIVHWYRASLRAGTASTKGRSDVRGSSRKIYRQKGTGKARAGSLRAPHRRKGGVCFGPKPRKFYYPLCMKVKNLGLRSAFSTKFKQGQLSFISDSSLELTSHKTGQLAKYVSTIPSKKTLLIDAATPDLDEKLMRASRSIRRNFIIMNARGKEHINVYHILNNQYVLLTERAKKYYEKLFKRLPY